MAREATWRFATLKQQDGVVLLTATLRDSAGEVEDSVDLSVSRTRSGAGGHLSCEPEGDEFFPALAEAREYLERQPKLDGLLEDAAVEAGKYVQPPRWDEAAKQVFVTVYVAGRGANLRFRLSAPGGIDGPVAHELVTTANVEPRVVKAAERVLVSWLWGEANDRVVRRVIASSEVG
jgi:hypothetical protein